MRMAEAERAERDLPDRHTHCLIVSGLTGIQACEPGAARHVDRLDPADMDAPDAAVGTKHQVEGVLPLGTLGSSGCEQRMGWVMVVTANQHGVRVHLAESREVGEVRRHLPMPSIG